MTRRSWRRWGRQALRVIWVFFAFSVAMPVIAATSLLSVVWRVPRALGRWGRRRGRQALRVMLWVFAVVAVTGLLSAVGWAFWWVPQVLYTDVPDPKDRATVEASTRNGMLATLAGVAALGSLVLTNRTYRLSQQGQLADRYTRAIAQLGDDRLDVRLGGIYALERIAVDSKRDHPTAVEVLGAYVRERSRSSTQMVRPANRRTAHPLTIRKQVKLGVDIQAALTVLGRLPRRSGVSRGDLSEANLTGAYLGRADLTRANLFGMKLTEVILPGAKLTEATLDTADLTGASLRRANLRKATFYKADLTGADLRGADLRKAFLEVANLTRADLSFGKLTRAYLRKADLVEVDLYGVNCTLANLSGANFTKSDLSAAIFILANLSGANLAEARGLFQYQVNVAFGDEYTQLPPGLRHPTWWRWVSSVRNRFE